MARKIGNIARFLLDLWRSSFRYLLDILGQTYIWCEVLRLLVGRGQFLDVGTFFRVLVKQEVSHFVCFDKLFLHISELIVLAFKT